MNTTTVNGITIPQGTTVQPDVWSLHYDPEHWGPTDPQMFDPDRYVYHPSSPTNVVCESNTPKAIAEDISSVTVI